MSITPDIARLEQALTDARDWYTQLKAGDPDSSDADEIMRWAERRGPVVQARAAAICREFGLHGRDFERWVWDVIISWRDTDFVLSRVGTPQQ